MKIFAYKLLPKFLNDLRLRILENLEQLGICQVSLVTESSG